MILADSLDLKDLSEIDLDYIKQAKMRADRLYNGVYSVSAYLHLLKEPICFRFIDPAISQQAMEDGSAFHKYIEEKLKGNIFYEIPVMSNKRQQLIDNFESYWYSENKYIEPIDIEYTMIDGQVAGTLDFICRYKDQITVIDWKSTALIAHNPEILLPYYLQISKYTKMREKLTGEKINQAMLVFFFKNKKGFKVYRLSQKEIDHYARLFDKELVPAFHNLLETLEI